MLLPPNLDDPKWQQTPRFSLFGCLRFILFLFFFLVLVWVILKYAPLGG